MGFGFQSILIISIFLLELNALMLNGIINMVGFRSVIVFVCPLCSCFPCSFFLAFFWIIWIFLRNPLKFIYWLFGYASEVLRIALGIITYTLNFQSKGYYCTTYVKCGKFEPCTFIYFLIVYIIFIICVTYPYVINLRTKYLKFYFKLLLIF